MRQTVESAIRLFRSFLRRETGAAMIEFALIVPIMLTLYIGSSEAATLLTVDRKVQSAAGAMGDLVARSNKTISQSQLDDYFRAANSIMAPYDTSKLIQTLIAVSVASDGKATVLWAARYSGGKLSTTVPEYPKGKVYNLPKEMTAIASGQTVIAAETSYLYPPLTGVVFNSAVDFRRSALFMPRFGGVIDLL